VSTKILVVEDDPDIRELLSLKLVSAGYDVSTAVDGEAALITAESLHPNLIVLDWMLPRLSGLAVCLELRSRNEFADVPVILLTAKTLEADISEGFAAGADDYITKPFSPRAALSRVEAVLARGRRSRGTSVDA
jgi:two-component system phosphate regulon response regulator PhoB